MRNNRIVYAGIGIIAALAVLLAANSYLVNGYSGNQLTVQLTDPPHVPNGTQQLLVTYSGVQAQVKLANGSSEYVSSSASGKVNLLSLVNASTIIGSMQIPQNSIVNKIKFNITNAEIEINTPNNQLNGTLYLNGVKVGSTDTTINYTVSKPGNYLYVFNTTGNYRFYPASINYSYEVRNVPSTLASSGNGATTPAILAVLIAIMTGIAYNRTIANRRHR